MTAVTLHKLTKKYSSGQIGVSELDLSVEHGELLVLLGPSGCGKTTTLRLLAGLTDPTSGDIRFDGQSVLHLPPEKRGAAMVFQQHSLFPFMSVGDNVAYGLKVRKVNRSTISRRVTQALAAVHLAGFGDRWPDELSGGQRQRVALARVLAIEPKLLLLDEPLSNLDPGLREELREVIRTLQQDANVTTILVTHDQQEAVALADRIALLLDGRLHQVGPARDFFNAPRDTSVARFFGGVNFLSGKKQGSTVHTLAGLLEVQPNDRPDGDVIVTIRPEAIEIGANGYNNLRGVVQSFSFQGAVARCHAIVNDVELQLDARPFHALDADDRIMLHIPRERICLLSPTAEAVTASTSPRTADRDP